MVQLLDLWDEVAGLNPARRTFAIVRFADPSATAEEVAALSVGDVDRRMLALRSAAFGDNFDAVSRCPRCDEQIELSFVSDDFGDANAGQSQSAPQRVETPGYKVEFRPPTFSDLDEISSYTNAEAAKASLMDLCITRALSQNGEAISPRSLPREVIDQVSGALEKGDPLSCTALHLSCPACAHEWSSVFDVSAYLWAELENWAKGILSEVHVLARTYGWSEAEILSLSARRRREYLEMVLA